MKISTKINGVIAMIILLNLLGGSFALYSLLRQGQETEILVEENLAISRSVMNIASYHREHSLYFSQALGRGELDIIKMEGLESFEASVKDFRATCMRFDQEVFGSLGKVDSLRQLELPLSFRENYQSISERLFSLHEDHEVCMPNTQVVFDLIKSNQVEAAKEKAKVVWEDEARLESGINDLFSRLELFSSQTIAERKNAQDRVLLLMAIVFGLSILIGIGVALLTTRPIVRSLRHAVLVASQIASGDRSVRVRKFTNDEAGQLLESMKVMLDSLTEAEDSLKQANEELEGKVLDRTRELNSSNQSLQEEVKKRRNKEKALKSINKELNHFMYHTSHDLKGPVASVQGLINVALMEIKDPQSRKYLELLDGAATRLDTILMALIEVVKIKQSEGDYAPIDPKAILEEVEAYAKTLPGGETVEVTTHVQGIETIPTNEDILCYALRALVDNAVRYRRINGSPSTLDVKMFRDDQCIIINVKDNGMGMPMNIQEHAFELFFKGTSHSSGNGMGLYLVQQATRKLKGKVQLQSQPEKGTTVTIVLPAVRRARPVRELAEATA